LELAIALTVTPATHCQTVKTTPVASISTEAEQLIATKRQATLTRKALNDVEVIEKRCRFGLPVGVLLTNATRTDTDAGGNMSAYMALEEMESTIERNFQTDS